MEEEGQDDGVLPVQHAADPQQAAGVFRDPDIAVAQVGVADAESAERDGIVWYERRCETEGSGRGSPRGPLVAASGSYSAPCAGGGKAPAASRTGRGMRALSRRPRASHRFGVFVCGRRRRGEKTEKRYIGVSATYMVL